MVQMRAAILGVGELAEFIVGQISNHTSLFEGLAFRSTAGDLSLIDVTLRDPVKLAVGIHIVRVIVGSFDGIGPQRVILGGTVDVASRVEGKCRDINATFLVTSQAVRKLTFGGEYDGEAIRQFRIS